MYLCVQIYYTNGARVLPTQKDSIHFQEAPDIRFGFDGAACADHSLKHGLYFRLIKLPSDYLNGGIPAPNVSDFIDFNDTFCFFSFDAKPRSKRC